MKLSDGIQDAYERKWSMINTFTIEITLLGSLEKAAGGQFDSEKLNLNIISLTTPDFTNDPIEAFINNKWVIQNGKDSLYRYSITFRDQDQMSLYKKFLKIYKHAYDNYYDDCTLDMTITKDADWYKEEDKGLLALRGSMVESVSNLSFSNDTENQIAEFSVNFKCNKPEIL